MKKLSKKAIRFIDMFLKMDEMHSIQMPKHDIIILYEYYNYGVSKINDLENYNDMLKLHMKVLGDALNKQTDMLEELETWLKEDETMANFEVVRVKDILVKISELEEKYDL